MPKLDLEAIKARCKKHEPFYTYSGEDGRLEVWSNEAAEDMTALIEEIDRLQIWEGLLEWLDRVYPPDVFTGESGDPGPRLVVLTRRVAELEAEKEMAEWVANADHGQDAVELLKARTWLRGEK